MLPEQEPLYRTKAELLERVAELNRQIMSTTSAKKAAMQDFNDTLKGLREELEGTLEQLKNTKEA